MKTCKKCGVAKPLEEFSRHQVSKDGRRPRCKECTKVEAAVYREANRDKINAYNRAASPAWRERNKDRRASWYRNWRIENRDHRDAYMRAWRAANRENVRFSSLRRRARKGGASEADIAYVTMEKIQARLAYYGDQCVYCLRPTNHIDHRIPFFQGGRHLPSNLIPCCRNCNAKKHVKTEKQFRELLGAPAPETTVVIERFARE